MNVEHNFEEISKVMVGRSEERVVKWCPDCGAIKVDYEIEGKPIKEKCKGIRLPKNFK